MSDDVMVLVNTLISKMESMDGDIHQLREQNHELKKAMSDPSILLKRAGFVRAQTPASEDVWGDPLRGDRDDVIVKGDGASITMPTTNEEWHEMEWDDIHAMAEEAAAIEGRNV
jgi:hypothetical protein